MNLDERYTVIQFKSGVMVWNGREYIKFRTKYNRNWLTTKFLETVKLQTRH